MTKDLGIPSKGPQMVPTSVRITKMLQFPRIWHAAVLVGTADVTVMFASKKDAQDWVSARKGSAWEVLEIELEK